MITTTELGQLATEYLDDRKQEFIKLEQDIKRELTQQHETKQEVKQQVDKITADMRFLVRRDVSSNQKMIIGVVVIFLSLAERYKLGKTRNRIYCKRRTS